jgi:hypothetical protein
MADYGHDCDLRDMLQRAFALRGNGFDAAGLSLVSQLRASVSAAVWARMGCLGRGSTVSAAVASDNSRYDVTKRPSAATRRRKTAISAANGHQRRSCLSVTQSLKSERFLSRCQFSSVTEFFSEREDRAINRSRQISFHQVALKPVSLARAVA